jgi:hypothetical protein
MQKQDFTDIGDSFLSTNPQISIPNERGQFQIGDAGKL